jgi:cutinase
MKFQSIVVSTFICIAAASPISTNHLTARQTVGSEEDELENGACRDVTFIFARGSTEAGNMVRG